MSNRVFYNDLPLNKTEQIFQLLKISAEAIESLRYRATVPEGKTPEQHQADTGQTVAEHATAQQMYAKYAGKQSAPKKVSIPRRSAKRQPDVSQADAERYAANYTAQKQQAVSTHKKDVVTHGGRTFLVSTLNVPGSGWETLVMEKHKLQPDNNPWEGSFGIHQVDHHNGMENAHAYHDNVVSSINNGEQKFITAPFGMEDLHEKWKAIPPNLPWEEHKRLSEEYWNSRYPKQS